MPHGQSPLPQGRYLRIAPDAHTHVPPSAAAQISETFARVGRTDALKEPVHRSSVPELPPIQTSFAFLPWTVSKLRLVPLDSGAHADPRQRKIVPFPPTAQ